MEKKKEIKRLEEQIQNCKKCSIWKTAKNAVPGEGPVNAKIMFLAEAPGRQEDLSGRPFIGRAGRLLSELLSNNRIQREKVFISSVIKHRTPKNREPQEKEILTCKIWWRKQSEIIKPKLIVLLGRVAVDTVLGKDFWEKRGRIFKNEKQQYFITYHPAAGIRFSKFKKILEKDFKKIKIT
jgi:DNA polymerase